MQRAILLAPIPPRSRYTLYCCPSSCDIYQPTGYRLLSPPPESVFRTGGVMRARACATSPPAGRDRRLYSDFKRDKLCSLLHYICVNVEPAYLLISTYHNARSARTCDRVCRCETRFQRHPVTCPEFRIRRTRSRTTIRFIHRSIKKNYTSYFDVLLRPNSTYSSTIGPAPFASSFR